VDTVEHLREIVTTTNSRSDWRLPDELSVEDKNLLNPALWG